MASIATVSSVPNLRWVRILPPCLLTYVVSFVDRQNFGFAMLGGMEHDLGITATVAGTAAGIFSIGYLILQVPGGDYAAKRSARIVVAVIMAAWGLVSIATGFCTTAWELLTARFLLGVAEGGLWPAVFVLISDWFPNKELARANALFVMGSAVAQALNGPLSGWLVGEYGWRMLFFVEGAIPIACLAIWLPLISDRPEQAKWLSSAERDYLVTTVKLEQENVQATAGKAMSYRELCSQPNLWKLVAAYFCFQLGVVSYVYWLPTIMHELTHAGIVVTGWLTVLPFVASILGLLMFADWSDRSGNRRLFAALPAIGSAVCLFLSIQIKEMIWVSYGFLALSGLFYSSHNGVFWSIPPALFPREVAGGARGIINGVGNLAGFFGPTMVGWFVTTFGNSDRGIYGMVIAWLLAAVVIYTLPKKLSNMRELRDAKAS